MATDFKLPPLGENISSGDVVSVLVNEGDEIQANQGVLEIETDKAVVEVPCSAAGKVSKIYVKKGQTVKIGDPLITAVGSRAARGGRIEAGRRSQARHRRTSRQSAGTQAGREKARAGSGGQGLRPVAPSPLAASSNGVRLLVSLRSKNRTEEPARARCAQAAAGPSTRRLARELGVDISHIQGTGPSGRITREDVVAAVRHSTAQSSSGSKAGKSHLPEGVESRDNWGLISRQPMPRIRKTIAANMVRSTSTIPHVTNFDDADITELERIRKGTQADYVDAGIKLTMMPFVMKAVAQALRVHHLLNASLDMEQEEIIYKDYVNLGVAVDTERGLVVPVVRNVERLSIRQIAMALAEISEKAKTGKFAIADPHRGSFTISNLGAIGGTYSTPIINPPQVAILLLGRSRKLPVVIDDNKIEPRLMMPLSLSYDHRLVDGAAASRFLNEVKNYLQVPGRLLLAQNSLAKQGPTQGLCPRPLVRRSCRAWRLRRPVANRWRRICLRIVYGRGRR